MPLIRINRAHSLSHAKAREAADRIARDLRDRFDLDYAWNGDEVTFERSGVSGRMHVGKQDVSLEVKLGLLLTPIAPAVEREINAQLDALFAAPARAPAASKTSPKAPAAKPVPAARAAVSKAAPAVTAGRHPPVKATRSAIAAATAPAAAPSAAKPAAPSAAKPAGKPASPKGPTAKPAGAAKRGKA